MPAYGAVLIDIDLGIGRQYGYRHPARHETRMPVNRPAVCHPERTHKAHGLCEACYRQAWRRGRAVSGGTP